MQHIINYNILQNNMNIDYILNNADKYRQMLTKRFRDPSIIDKLVEVRKQYVNELVEMENLNKSHNVYSKLISKIKKNGKVDESDYNLLDSDYFEFDHSDVELTLTFIKSRISKIQCGKELQAKTTEQLLSDMKHCVHQIPNLLHESVPHHDNEDFNEIVFATTDHFDVKKLGQYELSKKLGQFELSEKLGIVESAVQIAGNRGYFLVNDGVKLNYALLNYALDFIKGRQFKLMYTPHFMTHENMKEICQLGDFEETLYSLDSSLNNISGKSYLIATSEQPLTSYFKGKHLTELPVRVSGVSTCFRKETGKHGKDTNGIFRVHQFEKVEQFCVTTEDDSYNMMESMLQNAKDFYSSLGFDYRVVNIVSGALNDAASKKYDIEGWFPGSCQWRELVSCSNTTDYFSRRLGTMDGKTKKLVHMLNSTLYANTRTICCILESYQTDTGIQIPPVLVPYMGKDFIEFVK